MIDTGLTDFSALGKFLNGVPDITFSGTSKKEKYAWVKEVLNRFNFRHLKKSARGMVREYIQKVTGYSNAQTSRLILKYLTGKLYFVDCTMAKPVIVIVLLGNTRKDIRILMQNGTADYNGFGGLVSGAVK